MQNRGLNRPSGGETEEDLLRAQSEMMGVGGQEAPAAAAIRRAPPAVMRSSIKPKSDTKQQKQVERDSDKSKAQVRFDLESMEVIERDDFGGEIRDYPTPSPVLKESKFASTRKAGKAGASHSGASLGVRTASVMSEVIERDLVNVGSVDPPTFRRTPHPIAQKRTTDIQMTQMPRGKATKKSLFALDFAKRRETALRTRESKEDTPDASELPMPIKNVVSSERSKQAFLNTLKQSEYDGDTEIHQQNLTTLAGLTPTELLEEQKAVLEAIDPKVIKMLRDKKQKQKSSLRTSEHISTSSPANKSTLVQTVNTNIDDMSVDRVVHDDSDTLNKHPISYVKIKTKSVVPSADGAFVPKTFASMAKPRAPYQAPDTEAVMKDMGAMKIVDVSDNVDEDVGEDGEFDMDTLHVEDVTTRATSTTSADVKLTHVPTRTPILTPTSTSTPTPASTITHTPNTRTPDSSSQKMTVVGVDDPLAQSIELPMELQKEWLHMDKVEVEKLQWMQEQTKSVMGTDKESNEPKEHVRFDFNGHIMPINADVPTHYGLHHHGDEESRAGYSLNELVLLTRSTVTSQRAMAWHIITSILVQLRDGGYDEESLRVYREGKGDGTDDIESDYNAQTAPEAQLVLHAIRQLGIPYLIRLAVDEQVVTVQEASVRCLSAFLAVNEKVMDERASFNERAKRHKGQYHPQDHSQQSTMETRFSDSHPEIGIKIIPDADLWQMIPSGTPKKCTAYTHYRVHEYVERGSATDVAAEEENDDYEGENAGGRKSKGDAKDMKHVETRDEKMLKRDPVRAYVENMQLLPRLRYLLEVAQVPALVEPVLDVLLVIARHSRKMALRVAQCPRLLEFIHEEFVKVDTPLIKSKRYPYGTPYPKAIRLVTVLASSSQDVCEQVHQEGVLSSMLRYTMYPIADIPDSDIPQDELRDTLNNFQMQSETMQLWRVALSWGVYQYMFVELSPELLAQFRRLLSQVHCLKERTKSNSNVFIAARLHCMSSLLNMIQAAGACAISSYHERTRVHTERGGIEHGSDGDDDGNTCRPQTVLGFLRPFIQLFSSWTNSLQSIQTSNIASITHVELDVYSSLGHALATLYHLYTLTHTHTKQVTLPTASTHHQLGSEVVKEYTNSLLAALSMPLTRSVLESSLTPTHQLTSKFIKPSKYTSTKDSSSGINKSETSSLAPKTMAEMVDEHATRRHKQMLAHTEEFAQVICQAGDILWRILIGINAHPYNNSTKENVEVSPWYTLLLNSNYFDKRVGANVRALMKHTACSHLALITALLAHRRKLCGTDDSTTNVSIKANMCTCACAGFCYNDYPTVLAVHKQAMVLVGGYGLGSQAEVIQTMTLVALSREYLSVLSGRSCSHVHNGIGIDAISKRMPWQVTDLVREAHSQAMVMDTKKIHSHTCAEGVDWVDGLSSLYTDHILPGCGSDREREDVSLNTSSLSFLENKYIQCVYPNAHAKQTQTHIQTQASTLAHFPLSSEWVLMPLVACYNHFKANSQALLNNHRHKNNSNTSSQNVIEEEDDATVVEMTDEQMYSRVLEKSLFLCLVVEYSHGPINSSIVNRCTSSHAYISETLGVLNEYKLARLMAVFLTSSTLFSVSVIANLLECMLILCLRHAAESNAIDGRGSERGMVHLDFDCLPDIKFYDLYNSFVHQYADVSFGNKLFQRYLWLPLQQTGPTPLRTLVWDECVDSMAVMSGFTADDLPLNLETYLYPLETYCPLLGLYLRAIKSGIVLKSRAPVPYHIAIHHLAGLLWGSGDDTPIPEHVPVAPESETEKMKIALLTFMCQHRNMESVHDIIAYFYQGPSSFASNSYRHEPPQRIQFMERFIKTHLNKTKNG
eukprot:CFRG5121T1